jgi:MFS family permease
LSRPGRDAVRSSTSGAGLSGQGGRHVMDSDPSAGGARPVTARQLRYALWICFLAWTFAAYDFILFGNLLPVMAADFDWSEPMSAGINTWVTVGTALVVFLVGPVIDRVGRRRGVAIAVLGAALASVLTAVAGLAGGLLAGLGIVIYLVVVRSLAGFGYAEQTINATYLSELFAATDGSQDLKRRGFAYSVVQSGWPVGAVIAALSTYLLLPVGGWPLCFVIAAAPSIAIAIAARRLRESPQFLALRRARRLGAAGSEEEAAEITRDFVLDGSAGGPTVLGLLSRETARPTITLSVGFFLAWIGIVTFIVLGTSFLTSPTGKNIAFDNAVLILAISNGAAFAGYLFHGWLGDRIGRRNTIVAGWFAAAVAFAVLIAVPAGQTGPTVALYSVGLFFLIGPAAPLLLFTGESFPVRSRATGGALVNAFGQVGAIAGGAAVSTALAAGVAWSAAAMWWGCVPIASGAIAILFARNVSSAAEVVFADGAGGAHDEGAALPEDPR